MVDRSDVRGMVALVTGAASGIERATAVRLVANGVAGLVLLDRSADRLAEVAGPLAGTGVRVLTRAHDVADPDAWEATEGITRSTFGRLELFALSQRRTGGAIRLGDGLPGPRHNRPSPPPRNLRRAPRARLLRSGTPPYKASGLA